MRRPVSFARVAAATLFVLATLAAGKVSAASLVSIAVTPSNPNAPVGLPRQFVATGTYSDGSNQDLTATLTWSSSEPTIAAISNAPESQGVATGISAGMTTIVATDGMITGSTVLTVTTVSFVAIDVAPVDPAVAVGHYRFLTAIGRFSDGTALNLTQTADWSSSVPAVATVSNASPVKGLVEALAPGSTEITATVGSVSGATTVTVPSRLCADGPRTCKASGATSLSVRKEADPRRDEMTFTWARGAATTPTELGDPSVDTQYTVCVWDHVGGTPTLVVEMVAPAGGTCGGRPCWRRSGDGGFRYKNLGLVPNGIRRVTLEPARDGRSRVTVTAHGTPLPDPPMPFQQDPSITVQVVNDLGSCWGADYVRPAQRNTAQTLRAKERP